MTSGRFQVVLVHPDGSIKRRSPRYYTRQSAVDKFQRYVSEVNRGDFGPTEGWTIFFRDPEDSYVERWWSFDVTEFTSIPHQILKL